MSQSSTARQEIQRVLKEVHHAYYTNGPDPTIALRGYLDESLSLNRPEDEGLDASFEDYCTDYTPVTITPSLSLGYGISHFNGSITGIPHTGTPQEIDTSAYTTIPTYRFCRPVEGTVYRKMENFTTFTPATMIDEGKYEEYREKLINTEWLSEQPGRRPADDIIAVEAYRRLTSPSNPSRLSRRRIDNTRQLPIHSDAIVDMHLLRDLPPFPTGQQAWGDLAIPSKEDFEDGDMAYEDQKEQFCTSAGSRMYACTLHRECERTALVSSSRPKISPRISPCSKSCVLAGAAVGFPTALTQTELGILRSCLKAQSDVQSCALRAVFPRVTCAAIHRAMRTIEAKQRSLATSDPLPAVPRCQCSKSGSLSSSKRKRCQGWTCACKKAGRECTPELCHPSREKEDWSEPISLKSEPYIGCSHDKTQRPVAEVTQVRKSTVAGYGLFAKTDIPEGKTLFVYQGELFDDEETENRYLFYDFDRRNYLYSLIPRGQDNVPDLSVDAGQRGNESRFINTCLSARSKNNCTVETWDVMGERKLLLKTSRKIAKDEELFLDYGEKFWQDHSKKSQGTPKQKAKKRKTG